MSVIAIALPSAAYDVVVLPGLLRTLSRRITPLLQGRSPRLFVITSPNIWNLWSKDFLSSFSQPPEILFLPPGESHKRLPAVERLAEELARAGADRDSLLLAFGGGVLGDIAGFLAAIYMRGIPYIQIPTTFLAQVDSSIGGKTGVNLAAGKNLVGSFHHPLATLVDPELLTSLPAAELRSGLQESIKAAIIRDPSLFRFLEGKAPAILDDRPDPKALTRIVTASLQVKADVVNQDERENGLRMILNFGHTIGHAIEAATGYKQLLHGQAVGWGSLAALHLSLNRNAISRKQFDRMSALVLRYGPLPAFKATAARLVALTASDKKHRSGRRAFVLATGIGSAEIVFDVTDEELLVATQSMLDTMQASTRITRAG